MPQKPNTRISQKADIVFLIDVTGSMQPCIDALKERVSDISKSLEGHSNVRVDWRAKAIGYRDLEADPVEKHYVGKENPFVKNAGGLRAQLAEFEAEGGGGGIEEIPESGLDALMMVMDKEDWIGGGEGHRIIVLLTDAPTKTYTVDGLDVNDVSQKAADEHFRILMWAPKTEEYLEVAKVPKCSLTDVSGGDSANVYEGLKNLNWDTLYKILQESVSQPVPPAPDPPRIEPGTTTSDGPIRPPRRDPSAGGGSETTEA